MPGVIHIEISVRVEETVVHRPTCRSRGSETAALAPHRQGSSG